MHCTWHGWTYTHGDQTSQKQRLSVSIVVVVVLSVIPFSGELCPWSCARFRFWPRLVGGSEHPSESQSCDVGIFFQAVLEKAGLDALDWKGPTSWACRTGPRLGNLEIEFLDGGSCLTHKGWPWIPVRIVSEHRFANQLRGSGNQSVWASCLSRPACCSQDWCPYLIALLFS